jgi:hypothetical protein
VFVYCETPYEVNPEAAKLADCVSGPARNFTAVGKGRRDLGTTLDQPLTASLKEYMATMCALANSCFRQLVLSSLQKSKT